MDTEPLLYIETLISVRHVCWVDSITNQGDAYTHNLPDCLNIRGGGKIDSSVAEGAA